MTARKKKDRKERLVLIVEAGETGLSTRKLLLEVAGFNVLSAISARQGLRLFARHPIDLVLFDHDVRDLPFADFVAHIRGANGKLPIYLLSARPWPPDELKVEVDGIIEKMQDPKRMVERVEKTLG